MFRKVGVAASLLGLLLICGSDLSEAFFCAGESGGSCCADLSDPGRASNESGCDHCIACSVSHGHLQSLARNAGVQTHGPESDRFVVALVTLVTEPHSNEIFHPPIATSC